MRCKNCGWPNKPNEKECVKCHAPLVADNDTPAYGGAPVNDNYGQVNGGNGQEHLNKTVRESDVFGNGGGANATPKFDPFDSKPDFRTQDDIAAGIEEMTTCPKCGYRVSINATKCPNCNYELHRGETPDNYRTRYMSAEEAAKLQKSVRRPTRIAGSGLGKHGGTINPYMMNMEMEPAFYLKPIKRINERHEPEEKEYEGEEVVLNRDNTEANNPSITSHEQAVVTRVDGRWFIEDKSEQKTTFVRAANKIELHDGDIILLGNRLFEFHE